MTISFTRHIISALISSAFWTRLRLLKHRANASPQRGPRRATSTRHLPVDEVTAAAPLSQDSEFPPVSPETKVTAKANDQTIMIVARATVKGRSLRSSIRIPSKGLNCLILPNIAASPLEPHRVRGSSSKWIGAWSPAKRGDGTSQRERGCGAPGASLRRFPNLVLDPFDWGASRDPDPEGFFFLHHCVGSEAWSADGFTRAPQYPARVSELVEVNRRFRAARTAEADVSLAQTPVVPRPRSEKVKTTLCCPSSSALWTSGKDEEADFGWRRVLLLKGKGIHSFNLLRH